MFAWRTAAKPLETALQISVHELRDRRDEFHVLDVRQPGEWAEGHIHGAQFITGAELPQRFDEVPSDRAVAVVCGSGYRSSASGSFLRHQGHEQIINVLGGMSAWNGANYETKE